MRYTKKHARELIELHKDNTAYFDGRMSMDEFENMLRYRMGFGNAEATTIAMALVLVGAFPNG